MRLPEIHLMTDYTIRSLPVVMKVQNETRVQAKL